MLRKLFLVCGSGSLLFLAAADVIAAYTLRRLGRHLSGNERPVRAHEPVTETLVAPRSRQNVAA